MNETRACAISLSRGGGEEEEEENIAQRNRAKETGEAESACRILTPRAFDHAAWSCIYLAECDIYIYCETRTSPTPDEAEDPGSAPLDTADGAVALVDDRVLGRLEPPARLGTRWKEFQSGEWRQRVVFTGLGRGLFESSNESHGQLAFPQHESVVSKYRGSVGRSFDRSLRVLCAQTTKTHVPPLDACADVSHHLAGC